MFRPLRAVLGVLTLGLSLASAMPVAAQDIKDRQLKFSHVLVPDTPLGLGAQKFADLIKERSGGKITLKIFPSGSLGGDMAVMSSLQGGTVDFTAVNAGLLFAQAKDFAVIDIPFLFADTREADAVVDGPAGAKLIAQLPPRGLVGLAFWEYGFRNLSNSRRAVATADDIKGLKIRVVQAPIYLDLFNTLGANATPLPLPELYGALEQKAVDGQENPLNVIYQNKYAEVQKFVSTTRHIYNPLMLLMSKKTWDKLSSAEQKIIQDAANEAKLYQRKVAREQDAKAVEALRAAGVTVTEVSVQERETMRQRAKPVIDKYSRTVDPALLAEVEAGIAKVRSAKK